MILINLIIQIALLYMAIGFILAGAYLLVFGEEYVELIEIDEFWNSCTKTQKLAMLFLAVFLMWPGFLNDFFEI